MNLNSETMRNLFYAFNAYLQRGLDGGWKDYTRYCGFVKSTARIEKYPQTILAGAMREWVGDRVINEVKGKVLEVVNKDYEHTEGVSRNDIEDDTIGFYESLFYEMGLNAANLWAELSTEALTGNGKWADEKAFFLADRKIGKAAINNIVSGELSAETYETAASQMMMFTKADGKTPLGLVPDLLVVGPALKNTAKRILKMEMVVENGVAVSNPNKDEADILVNPYLTGENSKKWFLMCTKRGIKPVVVQKRKEGTLQRWDKESDECVKVHNRNDYGIHYRGAAALVAPQLIVGGNL